MATVEIDGKVYDSSKIPEALDRESSRFIIENHLFPPPQTFFLSEESRSLPLVKNPRHIKFAEEESEPAQIQDAEWPLIQRGKFMIRVKESHGPDDLCADTLGTVLIPRRLDQADAILLIKLKSAWPDEESEIKARFLVDSRVVYKHFPKFRAGWKDPREYNEYQWLGATDDEDHFILMHGALDYYGFDITAAWVVLTIIHGRWPHSWEALDLPETTLVNVAKFMNQCEMIRGSEPWSIIREKLSGTMERYRTQIARWDHPDLGAWLYIAWTFHLQEGYSELLGNLVVSFTYKGKMDGHPIAKKISNPDDTSEKTWFNHDYLHEPLKQDLEDLRFNIHDDIWTTWRKEMKTFHRRLDRRVPRRTRSDGTRFMVTDKEARRKWANAPAGMSAYDVVTYLFKDTMHSLESLLPGYKDLDEVLKPQWPLPLEDREYSQLENMRYMVLDHITKMMVYDTSGNLLRLFSEDIWSSKPLEKLPIQTPFELDEKWGIKTSVFAYRTGFKQRIICWVNRKEPEPRPSLKKAAILFGICVLCPAVIGMSFLGPIDVVKEWNLSLSKATERATDVRHTHISRY